MSEFVAGFAARHAVAAGILQAAFAPPPGFAPAPPRAPEAGPRHFHPADRASNPTAGWDPFEPEVQQAPGIDPIEAAHAAGYAEGLAAAAAQAQGERMRDEALLTALTAAFNGGRLDRQAMAARLRQTVLLLVTRVVGDAGVSADRLAARIDVAAEMLADSAESAILRVHPDDVALLASHLPDTIFPVGDPHVDRGSFVLESASTVVEDGPALWLEQLSAAIEKVALPC